MEEYFNPKNKLHHGKTILIADDDEMLAKLVSFTLHKAGFETIRVASGSEAVAKAMQTPGCLMLLDYQLNDMTGQEVIEKLIEAEYEVPFIVMTGQGDEQTAVEMMKLGARDYIIKESGLRHTLPQIVSQVVVQLAVEDGIRQTEMKLRQSEERFRQISTLLPFPVWICGFDELTEYVSPQFTNDFGYDINDIPTVNAWFERIYPNEEDRIKATSAWDNIRTQVSDEIIKRKITITCKDGQTKIVTIRFLSMGDDKLYMVFHDITESEHMKQSLLESEQKFAKAFQSNSSLMAITDFDDGRFIEVNDTFVESLGYKQEEIIGKTLNALEAFTNYADRVTIISAIKQTVEKDDRVRNVEASFRTKNGDTHHGLFSAEMFTLEGKRFLLTSMTDITMRKRAEEQIMDTNSELQLALDELKSSQTQLMQSSKLAAIGELVSGVAHELNNPLTAISMHAELLYTKTFDEQAKSQVNLISDQTDRAISIVENLLSFARKHEPHKDWISVNEAIKSSVALRAYDLNLDNIKIILKLGNDLPEISADFRQLQQVFLNLINNAADAMKESDHEEGNLVIQSQTAGPNILISFTDNGEGIPAEKLESIFDPFFTTKDVGMGTGLGLSICHGIIEEHGGQIAVESTVGEGTSFIIGLPVNSRVACMD